MSKRKTVSAVFTGMAVTGGVVGFAAAPALATVSTWTVTGGGPYTAHNNGTDTFTDITTNNTFTCAASTVNAAGSIPNGVSRPGTSIGTVTKFSPGTSAAPCTWALGTTFKGHATSTPWHINAVSQSSLTPSITHGTITGIQVDISGVNNTCDFTVKGTAFGSYNNSTGVLSVSGASLSVTAATAGCAPFFTVGNKATLAGPITVTPEVQIHHNTT